MTKQFVRGRALASLALAMLCGCLDLASERPAHERAHIPTHTGKVQGQPKRHAVWVPTFTVAWGADPLTEGGRTTLGQQSARIVAERMASSAKALIDDPRDDRPSEFTVRGTLAGSTRGVTALELELVSREGATLAKVRRELTPVADGAVDRTVLQSAADELSAVVAQAPWSSAVVDFSQRMLVSAAGRDAGLTVNELLVVRKPATWARDAEGKMHRHPGPEVARVYVDALLEPGATGGAYCRLWGGSFSGFELDQLSLEEP